MGPIGLASGTEGRGGVEEDERCRAEGGGGGVLIETKSK